jgi:hypothetical protein
MSQGNAVPWRNPNTMIIRAAMLQCSGHAADDVAKRARRSMGREVKNSGDATHLPPVCVLKDCGFLLIPTLPMVLVQPQIRPFRQDLRVPCSQTGLLAMQDAIESPLLTFQPSYP